MIKEEYKYSAITETIIGCAIKVHNTLQRSHQLTTDDADKS